MRTFVTLLFVAAIAAGGYWAFETYGPKDAVSPPPAIDVISAGDVDVVARAIEERRPESARLDEAGYKRLADALKEVATVSFGGFDGEAALDVVIAARGEGDESRFGVKIERLQIWGADIAAFEALASGGARGGAPGDQNPGVLVADRIEARGLVQFGLDRYTDKISDAYAQALSNAAAQAGADAQQTSEIADLIETNISTFEDKTGLLAVDGLRLFASAFAVEPQTDGEGSDALKALADAAPLLQIMTVLKEAARWARAVAFDGAVIVESETTFSYALADQQTDITTTTPMMVYKNYDRGDLDLVAIRNLNMAADQTTKIPSVNGGGETDFEIKIDMSFENYVIEKIRLSALLAYLEDGAWPPMADTDVMSLGTWLLEGMSYEFNGARFVSVERSLTDASQFHWLAPSGLTHQTTGLVYDLNSIRTVIDQVDTAGGSFDQQDKQEFDQIFDILSENGFSTIEIDAAATWDWDPDAGDAQAGIAVDYKGWGTFDLKGAGVAPTYEDLRATTRDKGGDDPEAILASFNARSAIDDFSFVFTDTGGIQRTFETAVALADLAPEGDASMAMLRGADPKDLRISSAAMLRLSAGQAATTFPPARQYLDALASLVQKGGVLIVSADPQTPVPLEEFETLSQDPVALVNRLNLKVEHGKSPR